MELKSAPFSLIRDSIKPGFWPRFPLAVLLVLSMLVAVVSPVAPDTRPGLAAPLPGPAAAACPAAPFSMISTPSYIVGDDIFSVTLADFNKDGKQDAAVVANDVYNGVFLLTGTGDGTFNTPVPVSGGYPTSITAAGLDNDFNADLVFNDGVNLRTLFGKGDGTFTTGPSYTLPFNIEMVGIADLNDDGYFDLLATGGGKTHLDVLINQKNRTFTALPEFFPNTGTFIWLGQTDLTGDGNPDLVQESGPYLMLVRGNGDGTFQTPIGYNTGVYGLASAVVGDFNSDGKVDVAGVTANGAGAGEVVMMRNTGGGVFTPAGLFEIATPDAPLHVITYDLNLDGRLDLVVVNDGSVSALLGKGDGSFFPSVTYSTAANPRWVAAGDLDNDTIPDLVIANDTYEANYPGGSISVLLGRGNGLFRGAPNYPTRDNSPIAVAAGDFNRDGKQDLAVTLNSGKYEIMLNRGDGTYKEPAIYSYPENDFQAVLAADFNGDSKIDLALAGTDLGMTHGLQVLLGKGDGSFQSGQTLPLGRYQTAIAKGDFNGDGKTDLAVTNAEDPGNVAILLGSGTGTFQLKSSLSAAGWTTPSSVAVADFDKDGKLDLAVSNDYSTGIYWFPGKGDGTFQGAVGLNLLVYASHRVLIAGDFDKDGYSDLAVTNDHVSPVLGEHHGQVQILRNNHSGGFLAPTTYTVGASPNAIVTGDFNNDGSPDLATANLGYSPTTENNVSVLLNNGAGGFPTIQTYNAGSWPTNLIAADLNNDGLSDLAVTNNHAGETTVLLSRLLRVVTSQVDDNSASPACGTLSGELRSAVSGSYITFSFKGKIDVKSQPAPLPEGVIIDGGTCKMGQPGVTLDGSNAGTNSQGLTLYGGTVEYFKVIKFGKTQLFAGAGNRLGPCLTAQK